MTNLKSETTFEAQIRMTYNVVVGQTYSDNSFRHHEVVSVSTKPGKATCKLTTPEGRVVTTHIAFRRLATKRLFTLVSK